MKETNLFDKVYEIVKTIPKGYVTTYGEIARKLEMRDVRKVGFALHANKSKDVFCHRVVNKEGKLASGFAFGGEIEQRARLEVEGVTFVNENMVNLKRHFFKL